MTLTIDNMQGLGPQDYTTALDGNKPPKVERKINEPSVLQFSLLANGPGFVIPLMGARVALGKTNGSDVFTGYITATPQYEYLGWGEQGPVYRYNVVAQSDEVLLNQKALPNRSPFVERSAGNALRQLAQDLLPGWFNTSSVEDVDTLASYSVNPQKSFSFHAAEIALSARASFRTINGELILAPAGAVMYALNESDANFTPEGMWLDSPNLLVNEVTVIGQDEPQAYVRDYFIGDGLSLEFYLSQKPFAQAKPALIDEEYLDPTLDPTTWVVGDPLAVISVVAQTLQIAGGTGVDGQTTVSFIEQIELGGALELQHGDVSFTAPSQGVLGGLYAGAISVPGCLAGFQILPAGTGSTIQALINGNIDGTGCGYYSGSSIFLYDVHVFDGSLSKRGDLSFFCTSGRVGMGRRGGSGGCAVRT